VRQPDSLYTVATVAARRAVGIKLIKLERHESRSGFLPPPVPLPEEVRYADLSHAAQSGSYGSPPALRGRKVGRLQKYLEKITSAHIVLSIQKYRQIAEVTLRVRDLTIRGEESTADVYSSIDLVVEKLERQL